MLARFFLGEQLHSIVLRSENAAHTALLQTHTQRATQVSPPQSLIGSVNDLLPPICPERYDVVAWDTDFSRHNHGKGWGYARRYPNPVV